ncbi:MAG TPA: flotillin domain-containing protein [Thermoanaerobaculia bacterium]|nr:flotillin domain-containing protein [Thermoanaerobaculia bacterium]
MENLIFIAFVAGMALIALLAIGFILTRLYHRASKEESFVRTGFGGQKVILNGGALILPVLHETIRVNMNTLRLEVRRSNEQALITRDRMRVDVQAEFYVRVKPTEEAIADAAQTLGKRTMDPNALKELVEAKFVDALRAVAAEMAMQELHEQRVNFVQKVQTAVSEDLLKNGLELESVSLTSLDQTNREYFNPNNAFDAEGLTKLTEEIETRRKKRNDIEQDTQVAVQSKNLEAERQKLELSKQEEYVRLDQQREIAIRRAAQAAEIAREQAEKNRQAKEAEILAKQQVDLADISAHQALAQQRIETERQVQELDIVKVRTLETAEIEKRKAVEMAEQDRAIAIAEKSKAQSEAQALADQARAVAAKAEEQVVTAREAERAERAKQIELVKASQEAEREAIGITTGARAEKQAAEDRATAVRTLAHAEADQAKIAAQGEAEAEVVRAEAAAKRYEVEATGKRALNEAANALSPEAIAMQVRLALLEHLPEIIREAVKPIERIEGIKIVQVGGLGLDGAANGDGQVVTGGGGGGSLADQVVNSALRYRAQAPLLDSLLQDVGLSSHELAGLTQALHAKGNGGAEPAHPQLPQGETVAVHKPKQKTT